MCKTQGNKTHYGLVPEYNKTVVASCGVASWKVGGAERGSAKLVQWKNNDIFLEAKEAF